MVSTKDILQYWQLSLGDLIDPDRLIDLYQNPIDF